VTTPPLPAHLRVEVTWAGNLRCTMRPVRCRPPVNRLAGAIRPELFRQLVDEGTGAPAHPAGRQRATPVAVLRCSTLTLDAIEQFRREDTSAARAARQAAVSPEWIWAYGVHV
jgi:hypothetical protein